MCGGVLTPRLAVTPDIPALTRLTNSAYRVEAFFIDGDRVSQADVTGKLAAAGGAFLVLDGPTAGELNGSVYVELRGDVGYFGLLSVDPERQGTGLGRVLVEAAEAHCRAAGCTAMEIDVVNLRTELPQFYERFGYRAAGTTPFPAPAKLKQPVHLVVMRKSLD